MPTLLVKNGFKFFFYANEHLPRHVHVLKGNNYAKIELESMRIIENYFGKSELKKVITIAQDYNEFFMRKWDEYFKR